MKLSHFQLSFRRRLFCLGAATLLGAGSVGCNNPDVQTAVVNGMSNFAQALISALFTSMLPSSTTTTTTSLLTMISGGLC